MIYLSTPPHYTWEYSVKTIVATATDGKYVEVKPSILPSELNQEWADGITTRLRALFIHVEVIDDLRMDDEGLLHIDIKHCPDEQRMYLLGLVVGMLTQLGLHRPTHEVEYRDLPPYIGRPQQ